MESNIYVVLNFRGCMVHVETATFRKLPKLSTFQQRLEGVCGHPKLRKPKGKSNGAQGLSFHEDCTQTVFVNRNILLFHCILDYFENGELHFPHCICIAAMLKEMEFWGFQESQLAPCCLERVLKDRDERESAAVAKSRWEAFNNSHKIVVPVKPKDDCKQSSSMDNEELEIKVNRSIGNKLHNIVYNPKSCITAKIYCTIMISAVVLSILTLMLETMPSLRDTESDTPAEANITQGKGKYLNYMHTTIPKQWLIVLDVVCTILLTIDFIIRLMLSDNRVKFLRMPVSIIDLISLLPVWIGIAIAAYFQSTKNQTLTKAFRYMTSIRFLRVVRLYYISASNKQLRTISLGLYSSWKELLMLVTIITMYSSIFALVVYYTELLIKTDTFPTAFHAFWWAVITMTTVGYGDFVPVSGIGYFWGILCSISGIVLVAMATTILVNNFMTVYQDIERIERMSHMALRTRLDNNPEISDLPDALTERNTKH